MLGACHRDAGRAVGGTGTVEVVEVEVAPSQPARVTRVWVREGDDVRAGDTLVSLTQPTSQPDIAAAQARLAAAEAQLRELEAGARPAELQRAEAELRTAEAEATRTARDLERVTPLAARGVVSQQQLDAARAAATAAAGRRDAARDALRLMREGTRPERVQAGRASVANARAALTAAEQSASALVLTAPVSGSVLGRWAEPGEVLAAGASALTLGEMARPWVRIYVDEKALPRIRVGDRAVATLDAYPDRGFAGRVVAINDKAEFTPRIALTETERADLLFGVKVELRDSTGTLKPGLPVNVMLPDASARRVAPDSGDAPRGVPIAGRP